MRLMYQISQLSSRVITHIWRIPCLIGIHKELNNIKNLTYTQHGKGQPHVSMIKLIEQVNGQEKSQNNRLNCDKILRLRNLIFRR